MEVFVDVLIFAFIILFGAMAIAPMFLKKGKTY